MSNTNPIPLNEAQLSLAKTWSEDDRLWTTQELVEINLRTFARAVLRESMPASSPVTDNPQEDAFYERIEKKL